MYRNNEHYADPTAGAGVYRAEHKVEDKHTEPKVRKGIKTIKSQSMADSMVDFFNGINIPKDNRLKSVQMSRDLKDMERLFWKKKYESLVSQETMEECYKVLDSLTEEMRQIWAK